MVELNSDEHQPKERGQALVEYTLILVLLAVAFGVAIAATGPAIGNVFCNVVHNIGGSSAAPQGGTCGAQATILADVGGNPTQFWATVTWVALNPQHETPFPTPLRRAPISSGGGILPTKTDSPTPTKTFTPTATFTPTPSQTSSPGPSPTNSDFAFPVPHIDQISKPEWWRLDSGDFMGIQAWTAKWYDAIALGGSPGCSRTVTLSGASTSTQTFGTGFSDINFSYPDDTSVAGRPPSSSISDSNTWGGEFTRTIDVLTTGDYKFTMNADEHAYAYMDGSSTPFLKKVSGCATDTGNATINLTQGAHTLRIVYADNTGPASFSLGADRLTINPSDVTVGSNQCTWGKTSGSVIPVSVSFMFENNPGLATWPAGQTCNLELRGYVDLAGHANPILSFWDIWDFSGATNVNAVLQVSRYVQDVNGFLDRSQLSWQTIATHAVGTSNYSWTRSQIDLNSIAGLTNKVTFRFVIGSSSGATNNFRWYIDDLQVLDDPAPTTSFTVGQTWDLNGRNQMRDFIYDGDSAKNIEDNLSTYVPNTREQSRWDLTGTNAHSGSSWDDSPGYNYQNIPGLSATLVPSTPRIHPLELKYPVNLVGAPATDSQGDTGVPLLTFWHAYDIQLNASIRVEYTRDANDMVPDTWTTIPNEGMLIDYALPAGVGRKNLSMQPVEIDLTNIPNWNTQPFRLRFALYAGESASVFGEGWYIDDIKIERQAASPYIAYPFVDHADVAALLDGAWDLVGGRWGQTTEKGSAAGSDTYAYSDSPGTQYDPNDVQMLQMHFAIDLLNDTPANTEPAGRAPAANPVLTFWHQRALNSGTLSVDVWTAATNTWTSVWQYNSATDTSFKTQLAWEPVEINLISALQTITSQTWTTISSNGILDDDDIKVRFNFSTPAGPAADGVYVDEITVGEKPIFVRQLWPTAPGGGAYTDFIESTSPSLPTGFDSWDGRWLTGGSWDVTSASGYNHSQTLAFGDSPAGNYTNNTFSVLEMVPTISLASTVAADHPTMYFWTRFFVGSDDTFQVEISTKDATDLTQSYNKIGGWSAWTAQPMMVGNPVSSATLTNTGVVTWERAAVNLSSFVGKEIRIRFVLRVPNATNQADGVFVDDVQFDFSPPQLGLTFTDNAQTTANWITEGTWGLGQNYFFGSGTDDSDFGSTQWTGTFFDCELLKTSGTCANTSTYENILAAQPNYAITALPPVTSGGRVGPENVDEVNHNYGSTNRPLGNATSVADFTDTYAARWTRDVTLSPGTYSFTLISKDLARVIINNTAFTDIAADPSLGGGGTRGYVVNDWTDHSTRLQYATFQVDPGPPINRTLTLEFIHKTGDAIIILNTTKNSFSFTDSPNSPNPSALDGSGYDVNPSVYPGNSSLMLNGFFNLLPTASHPNPSLQYQRLYDLRANSFFYVEVSTDGGFTWNAISTETLTNISYLPPQNYWQQRAINLATPTDYRSANTMIRFRLDTRTATVTGDGVYLAEIIVRP